MQLIVFALQFNARKPPHASYLIIKTFLHKDSRKRHDIRYIKPSVWHEAVFKCVFSIFEDPSREDCPAIVTLHARRDNQVEHPFLPFDIGVTYRAVLDN